MDLHSHGRPTASRIPRFPASRQSHEMITTLEILVMFAAAYALLFALKVWRFR